MKPGIFERALAAISPRWAASRARSYMQWKALTRVRGFDDDRDNRLQRVRRQGQSQNQINRITAVKAREEARWLEDTYDVVKGALDILCANCIGGGIEPEFQVKLTSGKLATELNAYLLMLYDDWIHAPEVTHKLDNGTLQNLAFRALMRDGEIFAQHIVGPVASLDHGTIIPYSLEMLEADYVPFDKDDPNSNIVQGIECNAWGRPRAIHVYKTHPGDRGMTSLDTKRVPAERMIHLMRSTRFHTTRGTSVLGTVINRFGDLKEIDESERVAARIAAAIAFYIKKGNLDAYEDGDTSPSTAPREINFAPGMVIDGLKKGEEIGSVANNRPNNNLIPFRTSMLASAGAGMGVSKSSLAKAYDGTYSSQRQELVEQYSIYRSLSNNFIFRWCHPVNDKFVLSALPLIPKNLLAGVDRQTLYDVKFTPPAMPWIDIYKEAQAYDLLERRKFKSRIAIIRELRQNPDQVNLEIARDQEERDRLGIEQEDTGTGSRGAPGEEDGPTGNDDPKKPEESDE